MTPGTCGAIGERAQVILVWVRGVTQWILAQMEQVRSLSASTQRVDANEVVVR